MTAAYPVFPTLYGYSVNKRPTFSTIIPRVPRSGREVTRYQTPIPLWEFELRSEILRDETQNISQDSYFSGYTDLQDFMGLFLASAGQFGFFFFDDTSDNSRLLQGIGTGDGSEVTFPFVRTITSGSITYTEPVGGVNLDHSLAVYVNGAAVPQLGNWSVSTDQSKLVFVSPPANGAVIQATFYYYYLCRFINDEVDFEEFLTNRWSVKSIRFRSVNIYGLAAADPLDPPPHPPPPTTDPPDFDSYGIGKVPLASSPITTLSLATDPSFTHLLNTSGPNRYIVACSLTERFNQTIPQTVLSVSSSSGLLFSKLNSGFANLSAFGNTAFCIEFWGAKAPLTLSNENVTFIYDSIVGCGIVIAVAIEDANFIVTQDSGVTPPAFDGANTSPDFPAVTITTTNQYDLLLWASGGFGNNNADPTGFTGITTFTCTTFHDSGNITGIIGYKRVSAIQSGVTINGASSTGAGVAMLAAIRN